MIRSGTKGGRSGGKADYKHHKNYAAAPSGITQERWESIFGKKSIYCRHCSACQWDGNEVDLKETLCPNCGSGMVFKCNG